MQVGLIGVGRMGANLARNMKDHGHEVLLFNRSADKLVALQNEGFSTFSKLEDFVGALNGPRTIFIMITAGSAVDQVILSLTPLLSKGDLIIDSGNSRFSDSQRRSVELSKIGLSFMDIGTSGGTEGARNAACMMCGGERADYNKIEPLLLDICIKDGLGYMGKAGSGHYVKMVHNGIEYGMMQAISEGFEILDKCEYDLDLKDVSKVWSNGSIISGYLVEICQNIFDANSDFAQINDRVESSGEGLWTVEESLRLKVPAPVITSSLQTRYRSEQESSFTGRVTAAMRNQFGGHRVFKEK